MYKDVIVDVDVAGNPTKIIGFTGFGSSVIWERQSPLSPAERARLEFQEELDRAKIEDIKSDLRTKRTLRQIFFPFKIRIERIK